MNINYAMARRYKRELRRLIDRAVIVSVIVSAYLFVAWIEGGPK